MKAIAVTPGTPDSARLVDHPEPSLDSVAGGRGVVVDVLRVGVDATDLEINEAQYGEAPEGDGYLVLGHESLGRVREVGAGVPDSLKPGTLVVATVRRPGSSIYDQLGMQDMSTDETYFERGISRLHGFLCERYVEDCTYLVPLPEALEGMGVLLEPLSISEKGIRQAFEIQRRLRVWEPRCAAVLGAGTIGMLAALALRLRGLEVVCYSRQEPPYLNSEMLEEIGVRYVSSERESLADLSREHGPFDIVFEATGYSPLAFQAMDATAKNGVLVLSSVTGGDRKTEVATDELNQGFVLGNKVMVGTVNAAREDFERGVADLLQAEATYPGWLGRMLTTPIVGLDRHAEMMRALKEDTTAIKVFVEVARGV